MSLTNVSKPTSLGDVNFSKLITRIAWMAVLAVGAYFLVKNVPRYLVPSEESYGTYYWPRAWYLLPHFAGGLVALVIGPFQFWPRIRNGYPKIHRIMGRIYLCSILLAASGGFTLAILSLSSHGMAFGSGLLFGATAWFLTSGMAYVAIRRRNFVQHKQWMIRSYVVTFAFVSYRFANNVLLSLGMTALTDRRAILGWACWAVPLLVTELVLQSKQVFASGNRVSDGARV